MEEMTEPRRDLVTGTALLAAFVLWTALVQLVDVCFVKQIFLKSSSNAFGFQHESFSGFTKGRAA